MAIKCKYCGTELPRDDARFCNNCGMLVPSHPFSPQSLSAAKNNSNTSLPSSPVIQQEHSKPALREQVAELPPARSVRRHAPATLPVWPDSRTPDQVEQEKGASSQPDPVEKAPAIQDKKQQQRLPETPKPETWVEDATPPAPAKTPSSANTSSPAQSRPVPDFSRGREPLTRDRTRRRVPGSPPQQSPSWPAPITHVSVKEQTAVPEKDVPAGPEQSAVPATPTRQPSTARDLHVKVWESKAQVSQDPEQEIEKVQAVEDLPTRQVAAVPADRIMDEEQTSEEAQDVEDLPTRQVAAVSADHVNAVEMLPTSPLELSTSEASAPQERTVADMPTRSISMSSPEQRNLREATSAVNDAAAQNIEYQSTVPLLPQEQKGPASPSRPDYANREQAGQGTYIDRRQPESIQRSSTPPPFTPPPPVREHRDVSVATSNQPQENVAPIPPARRSRRPFPFVIAAVLLLVLILGGVGLWIISYQPFTVAPITQPQISFSDSNLGFALAYPNGWAKQIEADKSTAHFYASNHTAEVDIIVANAGDVNQAMQQQSTKLNMGGAKAGAQLTFAGQTWQQLQGNVQQSGANYTATVMAATHGNHLYTIVELAPQSNYADWESQFFSPMRNTVRFL